MKSHPTQSQLDTTAKVVLYPAHTVAGYGHIYALGRSGIDVVVLSNDERSANFRSRYVAETHVITDPTEDMDGFIAWLVAYGKTQAHRPVLILAEDVYAYAASLFQEELKPFYLYPWLPADKLDAYFSKRSMFRDAQLAGLAQPRTLFAPISDADIDAWHDYPAVIKPTVSRFHFEGRTLVDTIKFPKLFGGKAVLATCERELRQDCIRMKEEGIDYCVQQLVPGLDSNLVTLNFVADLESRIPALFMARKIRQRPADFGTLCVGATAYVPELRRLTEQYCQQVRYRGPGSIEFKWEERGREWLFIENNPRLNFSHVMAARNGMNLALQQYLLSTGQQLFEMERASGTRYWIDVLGDVEGLRWRQRRPQWRVPWRSIVRPYLYCHEAVLSWSDPWPGLLRIYREVHACARGLFRALARRLSKMARLA